MTDWIREDPLFMVVLFLIVALLIEVAIDRVRARRKRSTVHRQDGQYGGASRRDLLAAASDLRTWLNEQYVRDPSGDGDVKALTLNTLVSRAVPGAVWDADEKQMRYVVREKPHVPGPPAPPRNPRDRMTG